MCELKYRNLFVETGKTREEVSKKLEEIWSVFFLWKGRRAAVSSGWE